MTNPPENVLLIGMPGAGKSTLGLLLAKRLALHFVDTDLLIQTRENRTLQSIVDELGYRRLRDIEAEVLRSLEVRHTVIATGGSAVYSDDAMDHLKRRAFCVYLQAPLPIIAARIGDAAGRGLARPPEQSLEALFQEREILYRRYADAAVSTANNDVDAVMDELAAVAARGLSAG